ncbi:ribonuclease 3 [Rhypophila decipiens]|uniref:Ribonuclease 3 n=1 Tax=Rhypophila decipiens TaxID=261697 RepID=A0AAN6Y9W4_9PEZI|nr:ribonuclease 3 [Rhypophila decipiens]
MPKRNRTESMGDGPDAVVSVSKRTKPDKDSDALQLILENADDLIGCIRELQSAKKNRSGPSALNLDDLGDSCKENISRLSQILSPAFQSLACPSQDTAIEHKDATAVRIPSSATITKWTASAIKKSLPPMPAVLDPKLEIAALTHSGRTNKVTDPNYERLEWLGDAYIYLTATSLIYQTFPTMDPGKSSQLREILLRNRTLGNYTVQYGLDKRANFPVEFGLGGRVGGTSASNTARLKARGDIFEAYVGALVLSDPENGVQRAADWLKALWGRELEREIRKHEIAPVMREGELGPKTELERAIGCKGIKIEYKDLPGAKRDKVTNVLLFTVGCYLTGWGEYMKQLGYGTDQNKKEAGAKAAKMALNNRKMLQIYKDRKKAYLDARAAQEEASAVKEEASAVKEEASDVKVKEEADD